MNGYSFLNPNYIKLFYVSKLFLADMEVGTCQMMQITQILA